MSNSLESFERYQRALGEFRTVLNRHVSQGTSPDKRQAGKRERWTSARLARKVGVTVATIDNWTSSRNFPSPENFFKLLEAFFSRNYAGSPDAQALLELYNIASPYNQIDFSELFVEEDDASLKQVPAAFRFGVIGDKIDAIPEVLEPLEGAVARDLYDELLDKTQRVLGRLANTNADPAARLAAERLLTSLGTNIENVRPGVVLSRMRSIEAIRDAFSSEEGRASLYPDAIAAFDDLCLSGHDFLATFPVVREIERQRIALGIETTPNGLAQIRDATKAVLEVASRSDIVAPGAVAALQDNQPGIEHAGGIGQKAELAGDTLLVIRNFVSESIRSLTTKGSDTALEAWNVVKPDFQDGMRVAARMLPPLAVIALLTSIAGPIAGLAGLLRGDMFKSLRSRIAKLEEVSNKGSEGPKMPPS